MIGLRGGWVLAATTALALLVAQPAARADDDPAAIARQFHTAFEAGKFAEAVPLAERYTDIIKARRGENHPDYAEALANLGHALKGVGRTSDAEAAFRKAIAIDEAQPGAPSADLAADLKSLAELLRDTGRFAEAEAPYARALAIDEATLGPNHATVADDLNELAQVLKALNRLAEAEPMMRRALSITEASTGPDHPDLAVRLNNLAALLLETNRIAEAEPLMRRALAINEARSGPDDPTTALRLGNLAQILIARNALAEAEPLIRRALAINEARLGPDSPKVAVDLGNLAALLRKTQRLAEAEPLMLRALAIDEVALGASHPRIAIHLNNLAQVLVATDRLAEAEPLMRRALTISEQALGADHPNVARALNNLAQLLRATNRDTEAEPMLRRAVAIVEKGFGRDHPSVAEYLSNLALYLKEQGRPEEAEPLMRRVLAIFEAGLGPDHPHVAIGLNNLALLLAERGDWAGALGLIRRSAAIRTADVRRNSAGSPEAMRRLATDASAEYRFQVLSLFHAGGGSRAVMDESFIAAQRALASEAALSMAQASTRFAAGSGALADLVRAAQDAASRLSAAEQRLPAAIASGDRAAADTARADQARLAAETEALAQRLAREFPDYAALASPEPLAIEAVQHRLTPDEVLVQFLNLSVAGKLPETSFVWVITKTDARWAQLQHGTIGLLAFVSVLRCGLDASNWADASSWPEATEDDKARKTEQTGRRALCAKLTGREVSEDQPPPFDLARAHQLFTILFGGMEDLIKGKRMLIVPAGPLTRLPFQTLVEEAPPSAVPQDPAVYARAAWLGQRHAITVLPSVASLEVLRKVAGESRATEPFVGFGNPLLSGPGGVDRSAWDKQACGKSGAKGKWSLWSRRPNLTRAALASPDALREQWPLPETADELCAVSATLGARPGAVHLGGDATEARVKQLSATGGLARARVVHFATHGLLPGETQMVSGAIAEPALLLTPPGKASPEDDGLLTASEVAGLKLDADWVLLSACNTAAAGQSGGEDLSGLARAFFYAGARALLVSHWYVDSAATVKMITRTFTALKADPKAGRAEALRRAMAALIAEGGGREHPAKWAPFILVGEGGAQ